MLETPDHDPLPPHVRRYAPWTWRLRLRPIWIAVLVIAYIEAVVPLEIISRRYGQYIPFGTEVVVLCLWSPVYFALTHSTAVRAAFDWQLQALGSEAFGEALQLE